MSASSPSNAVPPAEAQPVQQVQVDVGIIGGGIAGLWLLNALQRQGYQCVLLEAGHLGGGQTLASQGMIHGGLKYALGGSLTSAAQAIAEMPSRWRRCLAGDLQAPGDVDLQGAKVLSEAYYLWSSAALRGRLGSFLASKVLRGRVTRLPATAYPALLQTSAFRGHVYQLQDLVLDVPALLARLAAPQQQRIWQWPVTPANLVTHNGKLTALTSATVRLEAGTWLCCAGAGNEALLGHLQTQGLALPAMQRRPLHQVLVRHPGLIPFYAHYISHLTRPEPKLTVTSHPHPDGGWTWYLGGQLATEGVARDRQAQIEAARTLLAQCLPWLDWQQAQFDSLRIDRAEPRQAQGQRPDQAFAQRAGNVLACWPTKLSLAPDLADQVLALLADFKPSSTTPTMPANIQPAQVGQLPWLC